MGPFLHYPMFAIMTLPRTSSSVVPGSGKQPKVTKHILHTVLLYIQLHKNLHKLGCFICALFIY